MSMLLYFILSTIVIGIMFGIVTEQWRYANRVLMRKEIDRVERMRDSGTQENRIKNHR